VASAHLDHHLVPSGGELANPRRSQGDSVLVGLDLGRDSYAHRHTSCGNFCEDRDRQQEIKRLFEFFSVPTAMDPIDRQIIERLRANGRASFASIGAKVGLSPHGTADRVRRLERDGVITGYVAKIDPGTVGRSMDALVDVRLLPSTDPDGFERLVAKLPAVRELVFLTGRFDYQLRVACRDADDLDRTVRAVRRDGGVAGTETRIVMRSASFEREI
jgi:Lrp/AsnC family leucine-responsive transcriptional regulator